MTQNEAEYRCFQATSPAVFVLTSKLTICYNAGDRSSASHRKDDIDAEEL